MATMLPEEESERAFGGRYKLLEFLGEGSNARVCLAEDLTLRRRVALKVLRADIADDEGFLERFVDEMRATSALRHPRVLPVYDWGLDPQPYTVTEYLTGGSLAAVLRAGHRLTPSQALVLGLEAARALVNIHGGGRAHLGLVPSSILFDSSSRPYISDLGLAAALGAAARRSPHPEDAGGADAAGPEDAETGAAEAVSGDQGSAPRSYSVFEQAQDVHDLALVLCEVVTGARDLTVDGGDAALVPVTALGPLQTVLERAAAADPADRLDAAGLARELLRVAGLLPRPDPLPLATAAGSSPPPVAVPAAGAEAFEQVGPSVSERYGVPLDDAPRRRWPGIALTAAVVLSGAVAGIWAWTASGPDSSVVPEFQGRARATAVAAAAGVGWDVNEILVREPDTERGEVVRTDPAAGVSLDEGATLDVFVSLGDPLIVVADLDVVYGMTVRDATDELEAVGLGVAGETPANDEVVPSGLVLGLDVDEGIYELEVGGDVRLLVSDGPADPTVPAVPEGREPGAAVDGLQAVQLAPRLVMEFSFDVPEGTVIGFRPASGSTVPAGSTVEVRVSRGPVPPEPEDPVIVGDGTRRPGSEEDENQESEEEDSPE